MQMLQGLDQRQAGAHGPQCRIFVGLRITKVEQEPGVQRLHQRAAVAGRDLRTLRIVGLQHGLPVLGIALTGQHRGISQIIKHDGELASLPERGAGATGSRMVLTGYHRRGTRDAATGGAIGSAWVGVARGQVSWAAGRAASGTSGRAGVGPPEAGRAKSCWRVSL
jgi:hypothetical protein